MPWKAPIYRVSYQRKYGTRCFLKAPSYPICTRGKIDCKGVRAAAYYVRLNKVASLTRKIRTLKRYCNHLKKSRSLR